MYLCLRTRPRSLGNDVPNRYCLRQSPFQKLRGLEFFEVERPLQASTIIVEREYS